MITENIPYCNCTSKNEKINKGKVRPGIMMYNDSTFNSYISDLKENNLKNWIINVK